jgi:rhomboid protease GluP
MDYDIVIFWLVLFSCLTGLVMTWLRLRLTAPGWLILYAAILLLSISGWWWEQPAIVHAAAVMWLLLVVLPALIVRLYNRRLMQQQYAAARRLARILCCLHPADGLRELPKIVHALELAQRGELTAASAVLGQFQEVKSPTGLGAILCLYRITSQWEELLAWQARHQQELERQPQFLSILLRARGETGDVGGLVELYDRHRRQIGKLVPAANRDMCRLMLFAFCGKRPAVERLLAGSLAVVPASIRAFWLATADLQAGDLESARR